ncbi:MAG: 2-amino-4-hydroxy-6-hydroxymethyldihydropteridine diphosphokinase [Ruminococcaceae bacterium]|nr:2-amino-4-hydroxy-6-hydroxymethyldihydropteridine diphosphokinase [Oscillospiraceae bacterium]
MHYILALGSNLGDKKQNLEKAIEALNNIPYTDVIKTSSVYETEPVDYLRQDNFYNIVIEVKSLFEPNEMLGICMGIESGLGRIRGIKNGPRIIDLDIIFAEDKIIKTKNLSVPHLRYNERNFVISPLLEIHPEGEFYGINFKKYIESVSDQKIKTVDKISV